jgi:hypothetical protein
VEFCGGHEHVPAQTAATNEALWEKIIAARKNALKQAALIGFDTLFLLLFRRVTLDEAVKIVEKRLNITGRVILSPYAELGMDVDKPHQLEVVRADMAKKVPA